MKGKTHFLLEGKTGFLLLGEITQSMKFQKSSSLGISSVSRFTKTLVPALVYD